MNVYEKEHPHHEVWKQYTESLLKGEPLTVEWKKREDDVWIIVGTYWSNGCVNLTWEPKYFYRIRQKMQTIFVNGVEYSYPKPFSGVLVGDEIYYRATENGSRTCRNISHETGLKHVQSGCVHKTLENTNIHSNVINEVLKQLFKL